MLALVAAVEVVIGGLRHDLASPLAEDWRITAMAASEKAPGCDVLCFGDSLVKYGVLPRVIRAKSGLKSYNLATSGGTMPSAFFLLRQALDAGARPRAVVADFAALMLDDPDPPAMQDYAELATYRDCLDLAWASKSGGFLAGATLSKLLPSYQWRFEVRNSIRAAFEGRSLSNRAALATYRARWARESGAHPMPPGRVRYPTEATLIDGVSPETWTCEPRNRRYLERFLELAASHQITVYWLIPPLCPEAHARREARGSDRLYGEFVRGIVAKHPNVVVCDARPSGYDNSVHTDHLHLDRRGAAVLSADLASVLADRRGGAEPGPAWVEMPDFAGRTIENPPSSVAQSRASRSH
ncbi:hypothetical protein P12x_000317 [Tundrisphaera lichenicola]|uniref:hypothetical protein n=1 Tax=Tundrisphaera lichenicola TaxID=2029860 RepID=UPI003EB9C701